MHAKAGCQDGIEERPAQPGCFDVEYPEPFVVQPGLTPGQASPAGLHRVGRWSNGQTTRYRGRCW